MKYFLLITTFLVSAGLLRAQGLTLSAADTAEVQQRALRHVRQFEGLLNLIAQPDEYFREYNRDEFIRSYYREGSNYQIFRDSLVLMANDLNPTTTAVESPPLTVEDYLKAFFALYGKSPATSVFFSNYEVSPVQQGDTSYVEVFYDAKFNNRHVAYPDQSYPVRRKKATIIVQRSPDGWETSIANVDRYDPDNPTTQPATSSPDGASANAFTIPRRVYRPGQAYPLPIRINRDNPPSSLTLYRGNAPVEDLSSSLADSSATWYVSEKLKPSNNYQLHFYDPLSNQTVKSGPFAIKRQKFPWPVVAAAAGIVGFLYIITNNSDGDATDRDDNQLPAPPAPE